MSGTSSNNTPVNNNASAAPEASLAALPLTTALMPTFGLHKSMDEDELRLRKLGYTQTLHRGLSAFDNFAVTMGCLYFIGGVQSLFFTGLEQGGTYAIWINWVIASIMTATSAAALAEICSAYPTAGSIYFWAFRCGGGSSEHFREDDARNTWGPVLAWVTAWLNTFGWIMNVSADATAGASFVVSMPQYYQFLNPNTTISFPTDTNTIEARAVEWSIATLYLALSFGVNLLHTRQIAYLYRALVVVGLALYAMNVIWLPIAASNSVGIQTAQQVFSSQGFNNSTGFSDSYAWLISFLFPMYTLMGFDASGHLAEETKKSHQASPRGIFLSFFVSTLLAFLQVLVLMFCYNPANLSSYTDNLIQPIVGIYGEALGWNGQLAMNIVGAFMFFLNTAITLQAASRLVYAIARDGVLPFSKQIRRVNKNKQPYVALAITTVVAWIICCTILPSSVAFESITSASVIAIIASYGVVIFGRTFITFKTFKQAEWNLGRFSYPIGVVSLIWIGFIFIVLCLPSTYPVEVDKFNFSPLILLIILVFVFVWWFASARRWFKGPVPDIKLEDR